MEQRCACGRKLWSTLADKYEAASLYYRGSESIWEWACRRCGMVYHEIPTIIEHEKTKN